MEVSGADTTSVPAAVVCAVTRDAVVAADHRHATDRGANLAALGVRAGSGALSTKWHRLLRLRPTEATKAEKGGNGASRDMADHFSAGTSGRYRASKVIKPVTVHSLPSPARICTESCWMTPRLADRAVSAPPPSAHGAGLTTGWPLNPFGPPDTHASLSQALGSQTLPPARSQFSGEPR